MVRTQNIHPIERKIYPILQFLDTDFVFLYYQVDFVLTTSKQEFFKSPTRKMFYLKISWLLFLRLTLMTASLVDLVATSWIASATVSPSRFVLSILGITWPFISVQGFPALHFLQKSSLWKWWVVAGYLPYFSLQNARRQTAAEEKESMELHISANQELSPGIV